MFNVDKYSRTPIYEQVIAEFERLMAIGEMKPNDVLPPVRQLSQKLSVNPNTLQKAYSELERRGLCFSVPGNGRFVAKGARETILEKKKQRIVKITELCRELKECGVTLEAAIKAVEEAYRGGADND